MNRSVSQEMTERPEDLWTLVAKHSVDGSLERRKELKATYFGRMRVKQRTGGGNG